MSIIKSEKAIYKYGALPRDRTKTVHNFEKVYEANKTINREKCILKMADSYNSIHVYNSGGKLNLSDGKHSDLYHLFRWFRH